MLPCSILDPGIICFQHCSSKVFCFVLPKECPTCTTQLIEKDLKLVPFRVPYPFIKASQYPCSVILRPTSGDFLNDYNNSTDLHIALTTSFGNIVEFDRNGLQKHNIKFTQVNWSQCLLLESVPEPWHDLWDSILDEVSKQPFWKVSNYNEKTYNCYTFVLAFLKILGYGDLSKMAENRTLFCEKYIIPKTTTAGKYISVYRKVRDNGIYTHASKESHISNNKNSSPTKLHTIEE